MKSNKLVLLAAAGLAGGMFSGCDILKDLTYSVSPNPLEMHADSVTVTISATVPEKGMHKKAIVEITPMYGETALKMVTYQGEKAAGNGKVIPYKAGGKITYTDKVPYKSAMENTELKVHIKASKGTKEKENFTSDKIADATIITPYLRMNDDMVIVAKDNFVRVTSHTQDATINYVKDRSEVRPTELKDKDIAEMETFIKRSMNPNNRLAVKGVDVNAYASPEGEITRNENLANDRAKSGVKAMIDLMKKQKNEAGSAESFYTSKGNGEDWEGFKAAMQASSIEDKDVVLRILGQYSGEQREKEIRNIAKTFKEIEKDILPALRRSNIVVNYDKNGKTDPELIDYAKNKIDSLTVEEILFAGNLIEDLNEKLRVYEGCARLYPNDWRGWNNAGYVLYLQGKVADAKTKFEKSTQVEENAINKNNLGACIHHDGDRDKALALFKESTSAGKEVSYNIGTIQIQQGKYSDAVASMGNYKTFNKALAQLLAGDINGALTTIDGSEDKDSAMGYYLKAVCGARQANADMVVNNLKSAISKDSSLKAKASKDREFIKYFATDAFKAAVN
jgi:tetratricopeptide (TPR) repeat protein